MNETDLRSGIRVSKNHPRIRFRGALDSLEADILEAQATAARMNKNDYLIALGEVLEFVRELMSAEVNERPVKQVKLFGLSLEELHEQSHRVREVFGFHHPLPVYTMGAFALRLNTLRARIRETELIAANTFSGEAETGRDDIVLALNWLSAAVYWLFCRNIKEN
jgi:ethanolamine utilization cobalamin adenosyltransferase